MRGNPSGNFVPECEPRKGVSWRLSELDATSSREDSADSSDTYSLVLDSICYTKVNGIVQGGNQKSYDGALLGFWLMAGRRGMSGSPSQRVTALDTGQLETRFLPPCPTRTALLELLDHVIEIGIAGAKAPR
jgi:hypothetical protein